VIEEAEEIKGGPARREGKREGGREGGRKGGREGGWVRMKKAVKGSEKEEGEGGREGGRGE